MLTVVLTHDVDRLNKTYQYLTHSVKSLIHLNGKKLFYHLRSLFLKNPYWNFPRIIEIESSYHLKSTFFFLNETLKFQLVKPKEWKLSLGRYNIDSDSVRNIIRWLDQNGWEIGLHGSYYSFKDSGLLSREKLSLENILGHDVIGIRQHYLNLDRNQTWGIQRSLGFKYDSSWAFKNNVGFKDNKIYPFCPFNDDFTVIPLAVMDTSFMCIPNKWKALMKLLDDCAENNSIFVINWHQIVFNEREFPEFLKYYLMIIEECLNRDATFSTLCDVYKSYSLSNKKTLIWHEK